MAHKFAQYFSTGLCQQTEIEANLSKHTGLPSHNSKSGHRKLRHHHIVHTIGTVAHQQLPGLVPPHDHPHMGGIRIQRKIPRHGLRLGNRRQVPPDVPMSIAVQASVPQSPVQKAGTVQAVGPVGAAGTAPRRCHLLERPPPAARIS